MPPCKKNRKAGAQGDAHSRSLLEIKRICRIVLSRRRLRRNPDAGSVRILRVVPSWGSEHLITQCPVLFDAIRGQFCQSCQLVCFGAQQSPAIQGGGSQCSQVTRETGSLSRFFDSVETSPKCFSMCPTNSRKGLQNSVWVSPAQIQRGVTNSGSSRAGSGHGTGSDVSEVSFGGKVYQYRVLPFSLGLSPCTFMKCVDAPLRLQGISVLNYN